MNKQELKQSIMRYWDESIEPDFYGNGWYGLQFPIVDDINDCIEIFVKDDNAGMCTISDLGVTLQYKKNRHKLHYGIKKTDEDFLTLKSTKKDLGKNIVNMLNQIIAIMHGGLDVK